MSVEKFNVSESDDLFSTTERFDNHAIDLLPQNTKLFDEEYEEENYSGCVSRQKVDSVKSERNAIADKPDQYHRPYMVRYDPTSENHSEFELLKKKPKIVEQPKIVDKTQYYELESNVKNRFQSSGDFSILKHFKKETTESNRNYMNEAELPDYMVIAEDNIFTKRRKPFSQSEDYLNDSIEPDEFDEEYQYIRSSSGTQRSESPFFFTENDPRLEEGWNYISTHHEDDPETYALKRRPLLQLVALKSKSAKRKVFQRKKIQRDINKRKHRLNKQKLPE